MSRPSIDKNCALCRNVKPPKTWANERVFTPSKYGYTGDLLEIGVTGVCDCVTFLRCPRTDQKELCCEECGVLKPLKHTSTILVGFDGVIKSNKGGAATGVYFADGSPFNVGVTTVTREINTRPRAELAGAIQAVHRVKGINTLLHHADVTRVVFKTDSFTLFDGITVGLPLWKNNNWTGTRERPMKNLALWQMLDEKIEALEASGIRALFWRVDYKLNLDATVWAHVGFGRESLRAQARAIVDSGRPLTTVDENGRERKVTILVHGAHWCVGCLLDECDEQGSKDHESVSVESEAE